MSELSLLPWQAPLWRIVAQAIDSDRLGHALLLTGLPGTGKRRFARVLAAALWCTAPGAERLPCGRCDNCRQVLSEAHPGYNALRAEEGKRDISIEAVRNLCERLTMTSHDGRSKVAIVDPADSLNRNGVNALLKTIEEPPPRSHLLLISERPLALLPTLRSRCQQLRFAPPEPEVALAWLEQQAAEASPAQRQRALDLAHGAPLLALQLLQNKTLEQQDGWRTALLDLAAGRSEPLGTAKAVGEEQAADFLHWLYGWLVELLRAGLAPGAAAELRSLAGTLPRRALDLYVGEVQEGLRRLEFNAKGQMVLEAVLIRWRALVALGQRS